MLVLLVTAGLLTAMLCVADLVEVSFGSLGNGLLMPVPLGALEVTKLPPPIPQLSRSVDPAGYRYVRGRVASAFSFLASTALRYGLGELALPATKGQRAHGVQRPNRSGRCASLSGNEINGISSSTTHDSIMMQYTYLKLGPRLP